MSMRIRELTGLVVAAAILCAPAAIAQNLDLGTDEQREAGRQLYVQKCAQCHGVNGDGNGPAKHVFRPEPRDFTSSTYKFRTTPSGELPTDADIMRSIKVGMPYTGMPPWPSLSDQDVRNLMYYIKTFADDFSGPFAEVSSIDVPKAPKITEESIARGRVVYEENQCFDCHGMKGRGDGKSAPTLEDSWGVHIRPADLTKRWTYRRGTTREDIYKTFITGLDGSPMPSYEIDPPEDAWHLVNYVHSLSRDNADYGTVVIAEPVGEDLGPDVFERSTFDVAQPVLFPVVGQVIEPGRAYFPGVNAIEVRAIHNESEIAFLLTWHDMVADRSGDAGPDLVVQEGAEEDTTVTFADAVALQFPTAVSAGVEKPYLMFGDKKNSVDLWFVDLASSSAQHYVGRGTGNLVAEGPDLTMSASYEDGEWAVIIRRALSEEGHTTFGEGSFVPVVFSVWDGFDRERGNNRGLTSWYHVYIERMETESPVVPMMSYGFGTLLLGLGLTFFVRRKYRPEA